MFGFQWASWNGESLLPLGTAYEGKLYPGRTKTKQNKAPISVPEQVRPVIEAWKAICPDPSPEALMFPPSDVGNGRDRRFHVGERTSSSGGYGPLLGSSVFPIASSPSR